jgi:hypothetical protein
MDPEDEDKLRWFLTSRPRSPDATSGYKDDINDMQIDPYTATLCDEENTRSATEQASRHTATTQAEDRDPPTPSKSLPTSMTSTQALANNERRSPNHDSSDELESPLTESQLKQLAKLTDPQMKSFLASRQANSRPNSNSPGTTVRRTRGATAKEASARLDKATSGVMSRQMVKDLGISEKGVREFISNYRQPG